MCTAFYFVYGLLAWVLCGGWCLQEGKYEGEEVDGIRNGKGTIRWPNGDVFEGVFKDGLREGPGVYVCQLSKYEGEWKGSMRHGKGKEVWANGRQVRRRCVPTLGVCPSPS